jgi:hypothetical protein
VIPFIEKLLRRRSYYRHVFVSTGSAGEAVLADLRRFCRAGEPPIVLGRDGQTDVYATGMAAGRQEVFWRIAHHLHLDDAQLLKLKETIDDDQ